LLEDEDREPLRHQVIEITPIPPLVIEHRLHRLLCPCCSRRTCATLPADVEASPYGPRLSGLVGLLGLAALHSQNSAQLEMAPLNPGQPSLDRPMITIDKHTRQTSQITTMSIRT
jgi:hypothetical protein